MNNKRKQNVAAIFSIVVGIIFVLVSIIIRIPPDELTTYSFMDDEYSVIEEYVGGDAYNYIIGAAIVSGHIAGAEIQKAIFVSVGFLLICAGIIILSFVKEHHSVGVMEKSSDEIEENEENIEEAYYKPEEVSFIVEYDASSKLQEWKNDQIHKAKTALDKGRITEEKYSEYVARVSACKRVPEKK